MKKQAPVSSNTPTFNRELSILAFNARVLALAKDPNIPLLERLRFLFICSANLDEFFEIRVANLKARINQSLDYVDESKSPTKLLGQISEQAHTLSADIYAELNQNLLPTLAHQHIQFLDEAHWSSDLKKWLHKYFKDNILPALSPVVLDYAHPFPRLVNKSLNFIVALSGKDAFLRTSEHAIVHAPRLLSRVIKVPDALSKAGNEFIFLTSIIQAYVSDIFPGMKVGGCFQFRLTRNSDVSISEQKQNIAEALRTELLAQRFADVARLEIDAKCPNTITDLLLKQHHLDATDVYHCDGPVNLSRYIALLDLIERPDLRYMPFIPSRPDVLSKHKNIFDAIQKQDILFHHPFEGFSPIVDFIRQAILDPCVLVIKQTLYRTHIDSAMVKALIDAARAGKEVTAIIELRARFDEASNIKLANRLQEAGVLVVHGVLGLKTHAKMTLLIRREGNKLRRYAHLGTGNYHESTAKLYTDFGLMTYHKDITLDVQTIFQQLTGVSKAQKLKKLVISPINLLQTIISWVKRETEHAKAGKKAHIIAKLNGLTDKSIIQALYDASNAGVKIQLIVRGACCLRPGMKNYSENISVVSVLGQFLEHSRIYYFYNNGEKNTYCSSADWMDRNFYSRIEVCYPILDSMLAGRIYEEGLKPYLKDSEHAWRLGPSGTYSKRIAKTPYSAQSMLLAQYAKQTEQND